MRYQLLLSLLFSCAIGPAARAAHPAPDPPEPVWDVAGGRADAVLWRTPIGWKAGALAVAGDRVLVGTNGPPGGLDEAVLVCLSARTGELLWRASHARLPRRVNDIPRSPIVSRPAVDGDRVYYVSNRGELCCVGLGDGRPDWVIDMPRDLGVFKRDVNDAGRLAPSAVVVGDAVYCVTGNGGDFTGVSDWRVPRPNAPSFLAADKRTGRVLWSSDAPGGDILYGQWSAPAAATVGGGGQILFPGGDGFLYGFDPLRGGPPLWKVDCRGPRPAGKAAAAADFLVAPPLVVGETAYVSPNRDYEQNRGRPRPVLAVDLAAHAVRWAFRDDGFDGTLGPLAFAGGRVYAVGVGGLLVALDAATGRSAWRVRVEDGGVAGGVCVQGGRVYVAGENGIHVVAAADGARVGRFELGDGLQCGTPVVSGGVLYATTDGHAWALRPPP